MLAPILLSLLLLQEKPPQDPPQEPAKKKPEVVLVDPSAPSSEPDGETTVEYALNPRQAKKEMKVGNFYLRKGKYTAAVARFREALKWHPRLAAAYFKLGRAYEERGELRNALESYQKYLELEPKRKKAKKVRKAIARLERELKQ